MNCGACGQDNPERAKFCLECGTPIAARCASCGLELPPAAKFCLECGARTAAAPAAPSPPASARDGGARKVVTILFADLAGSTALQERLDAESTSLFMERYYAAMRAAVEAHGGTVVKLLGDGVMVAFGVPRVAEDDALRAVRAGVAMQQAFRVLADDALAADMGIGLRVAVNTGEVVVNADHSDVVGDPVNVAARLQQEAGEGEVVLGEATQRLVASLVTLEPIGSVALKGRSEAVEAYRVVSLERPQGAAATAFVGRDEELARLTAVYDRAVGTPASALVVLLGSPGLGKSRLIDEFARRRGAAATVVTAQCDAAGGATFAPLVKALRALLAIEDGADAEAVRTAIELALPGDEERRRIAGGIAALLTGSPASPEETFFAVRRFLAGVAQARPVLLVIDDLHWAEPLLLDLVEHLVQWGADVPLLVLVGARPELRNVRSTLVTPGGLVADVVTLAGLDAGAAMRLAANVIGAADLPAAAAAKVLATSEGNPLFVGELVRMLVQEGALTKEGERWTIGAGLAALEMPPTIHALLAARIERLRLAERSVLERAAVVGRHFSRSAVAALLPRDAADLDAVLESLRRSELIERDAGWFLGEPVLRFHHVLIRDAAYRRLLKGTRAELHGRLADWIEAQVGEAAEYDETIGRHLEQAHQHLRELGPLDAQGRRFGERASQHLAAAGRRALAGDDLPLAAGLLGRAIAGLDEADPTRADLALDWCEALLAAGDVGPAAQAIEELARHVEGAAPSAPVESGNGTPTQPTLAGAAPAAPAARGHRAPIQQAPTERRPPGDARRQRLAAWRTCFTGQLTVLTAPQALQATADAVAAAAAEFAALGDPAGEAKAHQVHAQALARLGRVGACEAALDRALAAARKAGDRRRANAVLAGAPLAALWGPSPVTRASGRCLDVVRVLRITQGAPAVEAVALSCQGILEALRGRTDAARRMIASSRKMVEELGIIHRLFEADAFVGRIELLEGDAVAAERSLRGAYAGLRDLGLGIDAAQAAALLARALLAQQRGDEAEALSRESEALAGDDLQAAIAWRGVRAEALAQRGEHAAAVELAQAAVTIAAATDALLDHADARLALAAALRAAGRAGEAEAEKRRAIELWEAKGATLLAERVRADKTRVEPSAQPRPTRPIQRHVAANAATVSAAEFDAAFASRSIAALESAFVHSSAVHVVDHPTESSYGREEAVESFRRLLRCKDPVVRHQPLATLGESLGLFRRHIASGGSTGGSFDVGAFEREEFVVTEPGVLIEIFAGDRLGAAVACLYGRYAERLADGRERERAVGAAAAVAAALVGPPDLDALCRTMAPAVELIDHRVLGFAPVRGVAAMRAYLRATFEAERSLHLDDILGLRPDAILFRQTTAGTARSGGRHSQRPLLSLRRFDDDGRLRRIEEFDLGREAEALAAFDELAGRPAAAPAYRRVRTNAAAENATASTAALAAADLEAAARLLAESLQVIHHPTGSAYGQAELVESWRQLFKAKGVAVREEILATLGDSLALSRQLISFDSVGDESEGSTGAVVVENVMLKAVDGDGRTTRAEIFAVDHLGDAVVGLYALHAERLPDGPARHRAATAARSLAAFAQQADPDRIAAALAPRFDCIDHRSLHPWNARNAEEFVTHFRLHNDLAASFVGRFHDVLALTADATLLRTSYVGTARDGGGAFENAFLVVTIFGADGRGTHVELWEPDREAEALARFDELAGRPAPPPVRRRVRANSAAENELASAAALAAGDLEGAVQLLAESLQVIDHPTGRVYGRAELVESWRRLLEGKGVAVREEMLATLGDSLALSRRWISIDSYGDEDAGSFGAVDLESVILREVDGTGRTNRSELFAADHLGDAIARLYARYAELLPEGADRQRAAVAARAVAYSLTDSTTPDLSLLFDPRYEDIDHRTVGYGTLSIEEARKLVTSQRALADELRFRVEDVLALRPDGLVRKTTTSGVWRDGGGAFERTVCLLSLFGADGRATRQETFDGDREAETLARFDALTLRLLSQSVRRRVRPNAATAAVAAGDAVLARSDLAAVPRVFADAYEEVHHPTGSTYGKPEAVASVERLLRSRDASYRVEPLAVLGDRLMLGRRRIHASAAGQGRFDVGEYENETIILMEVDAHGLYRRLEVFAADRLGDAIIRLYERHAEMVPEGERARAAAVAEFIVVTTLWGGDPDRLAAVIAPDFEGIDHRHLRTWSARGAAAYIEHLRALRQVADDVAFVHRDILALTPTAQLMSVMHSGTDRRGGGAYERPFLSLFATDAEGRLVRGEWFDDDRVDEALARFDVLAPSPVAGLGTVPVTRRPVRANAATRYYERFDAVMAARDRDRLGDLFSEGLEVVHHPTGATYGRREMITTWRSMFKAQRMVRRHEIIATLGDSLVLGRHSIALEGLADPGYTLFGPAEVNEIVLTEVDGSTCGRRVELFNADRLGDATACLYERYAVSLPDGPARRRAITTARFFAAMVGPPDLDAWLANTSPAVELVDHRILGVGSLRGTDATHEYFRAMFELECFTLRFDDILRAEPDASLIHITTGGTARAGGGAYERVVLHLLAFGSDGRLVRHEVFDPDRQTEALARFDELMGRRQPAPLFANAASRALDRNVAAWTAHDWETFEQCFPSDFHLSDRRRLVQLELDRDATIALSRSVGDLESRSIHSVTVATRGDRLALDRWRLDPADGEVGPSQIPHLNLGEVDEQGALKTVVRWDDDAADAAYAELDARFEGGEGAAYPAHTVIMRAFAAAVASRDWDPVVALCAPPFVEHDHRALAVLGTTLGAAAWAENFRTLTDLAPDTVYRVDHFRSAARGFCSVGTWHGTREGGRYEIALIAVIELDAGGRMVRADIYDEEQSDQALARFVELGSVELPPPRFANVATRLNDRFTRAWARRDWDTIETFHAPELRLDDRRRLLQMDGPAATNLAYLRVLFDVPSSAWVITPVATRGERLALSRYLFRGNAAEGGGPLAIDYLAVDEVDGADRFLNVVLFDPDELAAAYAELEARWTAGDAGIHPNAERFVTGYERCFAARDWTALTALFTPELVAESHRLTGWGTLQGPATLVSTMQLQIELAPDTCMRMDHVRTCAGGALFEYVWRGTRYGGDFENLYIVAAEVDAIGRAARVDVWEAEQLEQALARFAEIAASTAIPLVPSSPRSGRIEGFANAATRAVDRGTAALAARDWEGFAALMAAGFRHYDRTRVAQIETDGRQWLASFRPMVEMTSSRPTQQLLATRGERLALLRVLWRGAEGDIGPSEIDWLLIVEVDGRGDHLAVVVFDPDDLDAAYAELEGRWAAGDAATQPRAARFVADYARCFAARDWTGMAAIMAPDLVSQSHRLVSWGTLHGPAGLVSTMRAQMELAPDTHVRLDHVRVCEGGVLLEYTWHGTRDGGVFENVLVAAVELDGRGRARRIDVWEAEQLEQAQARFAELNEARPAATAAANDERFPNAASRGNDRFAAAWSARDWPTIEALHAPTCQLTDHRRLMQMRLPSESNLANLRVLFDVPRSRWIMTHLATRGERLGLARMLFEGDVDQSGGALAIEYLAIGEVDAEGRFVAVELFDGEEIDAAYAALDARYDAAEAHSASLAQFRAHSRAFARRDWDAMAADADPAMAVHDHRVLGWGAVLEDVASFVRSQRALVELSPDVSERLDHLRLCGRVLLAELFRRGTRDGGTFEVPYIIVSEADAFGRPMRIDVYDVEQIGAARARFEALSIGASSDPLAAIAKGNAATAWGERWLLLDAGDAAGWEALRASCAPGMVFEDRQRFARLTGDREMMIASLRERTASGAPERRLLGTAGERVALTRMLWSGGPDGGRFEIEYIALTEVDASGLVIASILFAADDARGAQREAWARWAAIDPAVAEMTTAVGEFIDCWNAADPERLRAAFAEDLVVDDHRRTGTGRSEGREAYQQSVIALWELAPDSRFDAGWHWLAIAPEAGAYSARRSGTLPDGGEFESDFLVVSTVKGGRFTRVEIFEIDAADAALARVAALRPDPLRIPPNAATRALDDLQALRPADASADVAALRARMTDDFCFDDRGRRSLVRGGFDEWLGGLKFLVVEAGAWLEAEIVATAGDRLALQRTRWHDRAGDARFEMERWRVTEVDDAGRLRAMILFDLDQRAEASDELFERYAASGDDGIPQPAFAYLRAWNDHDVGRIRSILADDFVHHDHRRTGLGRLAGPDAYAEALAALFTLSPDVRLEILNSVRLTRYGRVSVMRLWGRHTDGGEFESVFVGLAFYRGDQAAVIELFELDDLDASLARFEALAADADAAAHPDPLRIPPNAASRASDRHWALAWAGNWEAVAALHAPSLVFDDRRQGLRTTTDGAAYLAGLRWGVGDKRVQATRTLLATAGDRLELRHNRFTRTEEGVLVFEIDTLCVTEIDAEGRLVAIVLFEPADRIAASTELFERYAASGADGVSQHLIEVGRAWNAHDLGRLRALLPDDFYLDDRRRTGVGRIEGADAYIASLAAMHELSRNLRLDVLYYATVAAHGRVYVARWSGTNLEGGEFEAVYVCVGLTSGDQLVGLEIFELEDFDAALERFEALRPDPAVDRDA